MSTKNYDAEIQKFEAELDQIAQMGENIVNEYNNVLATFLPQAINDLVDRSIKNNAEAINRLDTETIRNLKKEISEVISSIPKELPTNLNSINWGHRGKVNEKDTIANNLYKLFQQTKLAIENLIRLFLGNVGSLLIKAQIEKTGNDWKKAHGSSSIIYSEQYSISNYGSSQHHTQLQKLHDNYEELLNKLIKTTFDLRQSQKAKQAAQAKNLWDSA